MARRLPLRTLHDERFLRELHHFLWTAPGATGDAMDAGWNCRDHAWITAVLARAFGYRPALFHGEAFFAMGPNGKTASLCVTQQPHTWVVVEGAGAIDLSVRPDVRVAGGDFRMPIRCVFANAWLPRGRGEARFIGDRSAYDRAAAEIPQRRNTLSAVYLAGEAEELHAELVTRAAGWIRSPLTQRLNARFGDPTDLYAALALHLRAFLEDGAQSLTGLPPSESWYWLARAREGAVERACGLLDARH